MNDRDAVVRDVCYGSGASFAYTGTAANSGNLPKGISGVRVNCTTDAWARLANVTSAGVAPAAIVGDLFCPAFETTFVPAPATDTGMGMQLSVIQDAAGGNARYSPMV